MISSTGPGGECETKTEYLELPAAPQLRVVARPNISTKGFFYRQQLSGPTLKSSQSNFQSLLFLRNLPSNHVHHNAFKAYPHVLNKSCASLGQWQRTGTSAGGLGGCGAGGVKGSLVTHRQLSQSGPTGPTASSTGGQLLGSNLPLNAGPAGAINLPASMQHLTAEFC